MAYNKIQTDRFSEVVDLMHVGAWTTADFEDAIKCYAGAGTFFLEEMSGLDLPEARIRQLGIDQVKGLKQLLGMK